MQLVYNEHKYPCIDMKYTKNLLVIYMKDDAFLIEGTFSIQADNGFELMSINPEDWLNSYTNGNVLTFTNLSEQEPTLEQLKQTKITAFSLACEQTIYNGLELELSAGTERFEYKQKDQTNIKAMFDAVVLGAEKYPYQSENGKCRVFTAQDIITLYTSLEGLRTAQMTYYHQLKDFVNTLETAEEINAVTYGQALEGEYLQHYNEMMQVAQEQMGLVLSKVVSNVT